MRARSFNFPTALELAEPTDLFRIGLPGRPKLRVGLLIDDHNMISIFAEVIRDLQSSNFVEIVLVVVNKGVKPHDGAHSPVSRFRRLLRSQFWKTLGWRLYERAERCFAPYEHSPFEIVNCMPDLAGIATLNVNPIRKGFVERFSEADVQSVRDAEVDVLVRFGFNILRGEILKAANYGVWSYHHGNNSEYRGSPPLYWEMAESNEQAGAILQVLTEELDAGFVLARCLFETERSMWRTANLERVYWGSKHMLIQKLWQLHGHGWEFVKAESVPSEHYQGRRKLYRPPNTLELLSWLLPSMASRLIRALLRRLGSKSRRHWQLAIRPRTSEWSPGAIVSSPYKPLESPPGEFYADPFLIDAGDRSFLFFERLAYATGKGDIQVATLEEDGSFGQVVDALSTETHLSYPHIIEFDGEFLLVPESSCANEIAIYRTSRFPAAWTKSLVILRGPFVDATLVMANGRWWCFATHVNRRGRGKCLLLFSAETPFGPWSPHRQNPIAVDPQLSRCAGAIVEEGHAQYRFSQDQAGHYGRRFFVNRIDTLSQDEYRESSVCVVEPKIMHGGKSTHSFARSRHFEVIDFESLRSADTFRTAPHEG